MATVGAATSTYTPETHGGTVTSWIPLTTSFSPPKGCATSYWSYVLSTLAAWDPGVGISADTTLKCEPGAVTNWWDQNRLGDNTLAQTSIGPITCPEGYSTGTTRVDDQISTFVACCPPDYTFISSVPWGQMGQCTSTITKGQSVNYWLRNTAEKFNTTYTAATEAWGIPINGYNIGQRAVAPAQTTSSTLATSSSRSTSSSTTTRTPATTNDLSSSELSTGAKAGIGIGAALGGLVIIGVITFILLKRRKRVGVAHSSGYAEPTNNHAPPTVGEMEAANTEHKVNELPGNGVQREFYKPNGVSEPIVRYEVA